MRAAPAFQVTLRRFGVWRWAVTWLATLGVACLFAWAATREATFGQSSWTMVAIAVAAAALVVSWLAVSLCRIPPFELRWDGLCWHLAEWEQIGRAVRRPGNPSANAANPFLDMRPGDLHSIIDLGPWMLLRFVAADEHSTATWLPVQRRGLEETWHAFRCTIYSPRPKPRDDIAAEPSAGSRTRGA